MRADMSSKRRTPARGLLVWGSRSVAWVLLGLIHLSVRLFGVGPTYRGLARFSPSPRPQHVPSREALIRVARTVNLASGAAPAFCLRRALVIWWLLRWWRADADVYCDMGPGLGHAWVEIGGMVVGDRADLAGCGRFGAFSVIFGSSR